MAGSVPAMAVALFEDEQIEPRVFGTRDDSLFRWGSITKTVTALTVLALVAENKIELSAPLERYVGNDAWANPWRATHPVRVIHLLELTAGFTDLSGIEFNHNTPLTLRAALDLNPDHRAVRWPPGTAHVYSNMTLGLTQLLIETITGGSYEAAVRRYVFEPLGMQQATTRVPNQTLVPGYKADGVTPIPYWHMTYPAYAAMNATLDDMVALIDAIQNRAVPQAHRLFSPSSALAARHGFAFTYASGMYPRVRAQHVWHGHGGDADGYRSRFAIREDGRAAYIININVDNPRLLRRLEARIERYLTQDDDRTPKARTDSPAGFDTPIGARFLGTYYPMGVRFGHEQWSAGKASVVDVAHSAHGVVVHNEGTQHRLEHVAQGQYRRVDDPEPTVIFFEDNDASYMYGELGHYVHLDHCAPYLATVCARARKHAGHTGR